MTKEISSRLEAVMDMDCFRNQDPLERMHSGPFWKDSSEGNALLASLSDSAFDEFDEKLQLLGNSAGSVKRSDLANWCVDRASKVRVEQVASEVDSYLKSNTIEIYEVLLLSSVHIDAEYKFRNGVELLHVSSIPNDSLAKSLTNAGYSSPLPLPTVDSVLAMKFEQPKLHWPNTDNDFKPPWPDRPIEVLQDTKRAIALARPVGYGIGAIASGSVAPDHYPIIRPISGWSVFSLKSPPLAPSILKIEMQAADVIAENLLSLSADLRSKVRISIDKLNGYSSGADIVDSAIDLRICLESIFLNDGNKEQLRHTLAIRAARFLAENIEDRRQILTLIKKAYDLTSSMVHSGKRPNKDLKPLNEAAQLAKRAILKILSEKKVDWESVELGTA